MFFIRFGKHYVNMARVVEIEHITGNQWNNECYRLMFDYVIDGVVNYTSIEGADMIALEHWLSDNSFDIRGPMQD